MKLSTAILLGDSLKRGNADLWLSRDGSCGCAFGGALLAAGVTGDQFNDEFYGGGNFPWVHETPCVKALWPWLTDDYLTQISAHYRWIRHGVHTLEQLVDYVRTIEPAEPAEEAQQVAEETEVHA